MFNGPIKKLEILLAKNNVEEEIEFIEAAKENISRLKAESEWK